MMNEAIAVFRGQYLDSGGVTEITSSPVEARGNNVVVSVLGRNIVASGGDLTVSIEGSYDGMAWEDMSTSVSLSTFGHGSAEKTGLDYAFVRLRGAVDGTTEALFDATLAFSEQ